MPMLATTKNGATSWKIIAESFGAVNALPETNITVNLRLPGQYFDLETGNHYNFHRDYKPNQGRYIQSDPLGTSAGSNLFLYANGQPLKIADWLGLFASIDQDCCNQNSNLFEEVKNACELVGKNIRYPGLRMCLEQRCNEGHISCDGWWCWESNVLFPLIDDGLNWIFDHLGLTPDFSTPNRLGWARPTWLGWPEPKTAHLCMATSQSNSNGLYGWGCVAIHEWAHTCGWDHGEGKGIPDETTGDFISTCRNFWNPANKGPGR
jgi:RHS repeat-associated protein